LLLHAPFKEDEDTLKAWPVFESYVPHRVRVLGISNCALPQLVKVYEAAKIPPVIVQNRFYKETGFDLDVRAFCKEHGILYQAFWMLSHNPEVLESEVLSSAAQKLGVEKELVFYLLILSLGDIQILDGTKKPERMTADIRAVEELHSGGKMWEDLQPFIPQFEALLEKLTAEKSKV
jgi:diketogulonate reductase-like aldo/keto reductase